MKHSVRRSEMDNWVDITMVFFVWSLFLGLAVHTLTWDHMYKRLTEERMRASRIGTELAKERMGRTLR